MAESESGQDKTEQPTQKKIEDGRKEGQVARSKELNTMIGMLFSSIGFVMLGEFMITRIIELFSGHLVIEAAKMKDPSSMINAFAEATLDALLLLSPFFLIMYISVFIGPLTVGGWNFSAKSMAFKFSKMDPLKGMKRVFGPNGLVELLKALAKFVLLGTVAILLFKWQLGALMGLGVEPLRQGMVHGAQFLFMLFFAMTAVLVIIASVDVPYQLWTHTKKLRMTRQQVREENKQTEGNPEVKGKIRMLQRQAAQRRMLEEIPTADVIIVNPTHFSVALRYEEGQEGAPKLIAKGVDEIALKIREIGNKHDIPIFSAPPLARALYFSTEIEQNIPEGLFVAVARVLAYIFQLKQPGMYPDKPQDFEIPSEFTQLSRKYNKFDR